MDSEIRELVKESVEISRENNVLLEKLVWHQKVSSWLSYLKWIIIIGSTVGALYYLQPMMDNLLGQYKELLGTVSDISVSSLPKK